MWLQQAVAGCGTSKSGSVTDKFDLIGFYYWKQ